MPEVFEFSRKMPTYREIDGGRRFHYNKNHRPICPNEGSDLVPVGRINDGVLMEAGLLCRCRKCVYLYNLFSGKECALSD